jgi:hypothetical protein
MKANKVHKYEVISANRYNVLGYVYARDIAHAWSQAYARYTCAVVVVGQ